MEEFSVVGKSIPRVDAIFKATGQAKYTDDLEFPNMLVGKIVRSKLAHAIIKQIDTSKAKALVGVKAVVTGEDTPKKKFGVFGKTSDEYPLAVEKVRYVGEPVVAIAAVDEETALKAMELIEISYEELPAVFDPDEALKSNESQIHDHAQDNVSFSRTRNYGNVEAGFQEADFVIEDFFETQPVTHCPMEPHAAIAICDLKGYITLYNTTQSPYLCRFDLARTLDMPEGKIRVIKPFLGGGFGGKLEMHSIDFCAAFLSQKTGSPVKIVLNRDEEFIGTRQRHPMKIYLKTGVKKDGTLTAKHCKIVANNGAYNSHGPIVLGLAGTYMAATYKLQNIKYEWYLVYTNTPVGGTQRGIGNVQMRFADDSHMDHIAEVIGIDPAELRLKNAMELGYTPPNKLKIQSCGLKECIEKAVEKSGWHQKRGKLPKGKGIGIACSMFESGGRYKQHAVSAAFIKMHEDGSATLQAGAADIGQGSDTILSQIAAEELGLKVDDIKIITADTELAPMDIGSYGSRVTLAAGNAVKRAAEKAKEAILEIAAEELKVDKKDLVAREGKVFMKENLEKSISISEVVKLSLKLYGRPIMAEGVFNPGTDFTDKETGEGNISPAYSFGAQVAEVEVDMDTGKVEVKKITAAHDCGRAINPMSVEGQMHGCIINGIGEALFEEIKRDNNGKTLNSNFLDYRLTTAVDIPIIENIIVETNDPLGPFGAKEASEGPQIPTAPAIANAIFDAIGVRIHSLPITPEKILKAIKKQALDYPIGREES